MNCNDLRDLGNIGSCGIIKPHITMDMAGDVVGLDLTKPIDCSQMTIREISCNKYDTMDYTQKIKINRTTILHAYVFNEDGEREELEITFELKSDRMPKLKDALK